MKKKVCENCVHFELRGAPRTMAAGSLLGGDSHVQRRLCHLPMKPFINARWTRNLEPEIKTCKDFKEVKNGKTN